MKAPQRLAYGNFGTVRCGFTREEQPSQTQLGPGLYSLSTLSNVPYVKLVGLQGSEKTFSWGELVEVPEGQSAIVHNASYHDGEIILNCGQDYAALPARITVPVQFAPSAGDGPAIFRVQRWVDVRRARQAWLVINATWGGIANTTINVIGKARQRQHDINTPSAPAGYLNPIVVAPGTTVTYIPLGYGCDFSTTSEPMALLDTAQPTNTFDFASWTSVDDGANAYYILEY